MTEFPTVEAVKEYVGGRPLLGRLALQVKEKPDGSLKLRLITDLLRSQGNWFLRAPERIVLSRLVDAVEMALYALDGIELREGRKGNRSGVGIGGRQGRLLQHPRGPPGPAGHVLRLGLPSLRRGPVSTHLGTLRGLHGPRSTRAL